MLREYRLSLVVPFLQIALARHRQLRHPFLFAATAKAVIVPSQQLLLLDFGSRPLLNHLLPHLLPPVLLLYHHLLFPGFFQIIQLQRTVHLHPSLLPQQDGILRLPLVII